jgi:type I restriction enzyme, R subunit
MALTPINSEDRLVQATFAEHLKNKLGWESVYAFNEETFGPGGTLGRKDASEAVLTRDLRAALECLNPDLPPAAIDDATRALTARDFSRSMVQHNQDFYRLIRKGVPVSYRDAAGHLRNARARAIDFENKPGANRFLAVRELKLTGLRTPNYNRRADLVCFVNGLPLVFIELKAVYKNIRAGFDGNLRDYMDENVVAHAFHHNAFLIVSNGHRARYGSITSEWEHFYEWKRLIEADKGKVDAEILLDGMLAHDRLLDIVENFILFDESKPGATRKVVARNHQVLGVNLAVSSVEHQEVLKREFPLEQRLQHRVIELPLERRVIADERRHLSAPQGETGAPALPSFIPEGPVEIVERAHPDLGRLGIFWHTQGSGKSYSMAFFAEKIRRKVPGNFTFLLMTDRHDLDDQIYKTFAGSGITGRDTPRAETGDDLKRLLKENHPYVFSLIHKFNKNVDPEHPYSVRDDIIVISDEAHRTQSGRLARNMRVALPNAAFIGFTGTPLFKQDEITKRIFGDYVSRYDFKRSEEDGSTVKLVYENRGEKLGVARLDLNDRIAQKIEEAELDPDQTALLEKLLGKDYEVITADERLDKIAVDFAEHCTTRWESGKSMLVCIDKITCARMYQRITPLWQAKSVRVRTALEAKKAEAEAIGDDTATRAALLDEAAKLSAQASWLDETVIEIIISEAQNEVADFKKWGFDIIPHRALMKQGFDTDNGKRVDVETAFKTPAHPFRVVIVCAMWLTGFDVESLSTLYIDKPMKAHTLMQAIARANRVYPGKDFGLIVDYNGMLKSLREALAKYALGDDGSGGEEIVAPIDERVQALIEAIEATEAHLRDLGFDPATLVGATGFVRIKALADAEEAVYSSDEAKRRFEILARQVFIRFKALLFAYAERHDNIEAIYKKLTERRDTADVTELLKQLHRIVNEAIRTQAAGGDQAEGLTFDLSKINLERLRAEFAKKVARKATAIQDIRDIVEKRLAEMLARNPARMDYQRKYEEIIADYNREKDRTTIEETFRRLVELVNSLDEEQKRATREGLGEDELALFDLLRKDGLDRTRERVKQASRELLASIKARLAELDRFWEKEQTKADVEVFILDELFAKLPSPPFTAEEKTHLAAGVYAHIWQQAIGSDLATAA